jgi:hypothetical protein
MRYLSRWLRRPSPVPKGVIPDRRFRPLVEPLEDRRLLATFTVANLHDAGAGSLRQALLDANSTGGADVIRFQVTGTIRLTSAALPAVTDAVTIDGTTAPGFAGTPRVEVDADGFGGLCFIDGSAGSALRSLGLVNAGGDGVVLGAGNVTVVGNYIGLRLDGKSPAGNGGNGLTVLASSTSDVIGGPGAATGDPSNVISGNQGNGLVLDGCANNLVTNNYIGTDAGGTKAVPNGGNGILLTEGASANTLGGTQPGEKHGTRPPDFTGTRPPQGNLVSANRGNGILLTGGATGNVLEGNFVGTDQSGLQALGNRLDGVVIEDGSNNNSLLGTTKTQEPFIYYNVVSGNGGNGLRITDSNGTVVLANFFGLGSNDKKPLGNRLNGVVVEGSSANTTFGGRIPLGNCVAANGENGVLVTDTVSGFDSFNTFCGEGAFVTRTDLGNGKDGFLITATGGNNVLEVNQVDNNGRNGIEISGEASRVQVTINIVGGFIEGNAALPNHGNGVEISGDAHDNLIGGVPSEGTIGSHNVFSCNDGYGLAISGTAHDNQVNNTFIGTDVQGNARGGILLGPGTYGTLIGSTFSSLPTVISGNLGDGIDLKGTRDNVIIGTHVGEEEKGKPKPNAGDGIRIFQSSDNVIGGTAAGLVNHIAFNAGDGVFVQSGESNVIIGNSIFANGGLGIRLAPGANGGQPAPVLTSAVTVPGGVRVSATLTAAPNTSYVIDLYAGGGKTFLGSLKVTTDGHGVASFTFDGLSADANDFVATATDAQGNTSEFSPAKKKGG